MPAQAQLSIPCTATADSLTGNGSAQRGTSAALKAAALAERVGAADKR